MDKYTKHTFLEHPNHPKMGYVCQLLLLSGTVVLAITSIIDQSLEIFFIRLVILGVIMWLIRMMTYLMQIFYQLHYRWHIFGK